MRKLFLWSQAHPILALSILIFISLLSIDGARRVTMDPSTERMIKKGDPSKAIYQDTVDIFGSDDILVIFAQDENLFTPDRLADLEELASSLEELPGVNKAESLFTVSNFRSEGGMLDSGPLMEWAPETPEEAEEVKQHALKNPILRRNLISLKGDATAINLYLEPGSKDPDFDVKIATLVQEQLESFKTKFQTLFQMGEPYIIKSYNDILTSDGRSIIAFGVLLIFLLLMVTMRSLTAAILPVLTSGLSILWTLGFMGYLGIPITVLTFIVPSLLIVIGSTEDAHVLAEYMEGIREKKERGEAVRYMAGKVGTAVLVTATTTFIGFASISINRVIILKEFGICAGFGLFVNPLITVVLGSLYLNYLGPLKRKEKSRSSLEVRLIEFSDLLITIIQKYRKPLLYVFSAFILIGGIYGFRVRVDNNTLGYFRADSPIIQRVKTLQRNLAGSSTFLIRIKGRKGDFLRPDILKRVSSLQDFMHHKGWFDKTISFTDYLKLIHREMNGGEDGYFAIPDSTNTIQEYTLFLKREDVERYVSFDYGDLVIVIRHNIYSSKELNTVLSALKAKLPDFIPDYLDVFITGETILVNNAVDSIARGQVLSILLVAGVIFILMSILFTNIKAGFFSLVPNLFPIALNFGIMTLFDIPLNTGTCMVAAMAIGIAVDDTIHLMSRYNKEMRDLQDSSKALHSSLRGELLPVMSTSFSLFIGFGSVGVLSQFVPISHFGLLSAMVMVFALLGDLLLTPIILSFTQLVTLVDMLALKLRREVISHSRLFQDFKKSQIKKIVLLTKVIEREAGELAVSQGEHGKTMFLILDGEASVVVREDRTMKEIELAKLSPGDVFGEVALVNPGVRTASIRATTDLQYVEFDWAGLERVRSVYPRIASKLFFNISKILGERLAETDRLLLKSAS